MAIKLLCTYLFEGLGCRKIIIQHSARNVHAIKAYQKAGFTEEMNLPTGFKHDYYDSVVLSLLYIK